MESITIKQANTQYDVYPLIGKRWSARSFSGEEIPEESLQRYIEAASWAASANNEQPWEFWYAQKGSEGYQAIFDCLMDGNKPWAKNAGAFIVCLSHTHFKVSGKPNAWASHDTGMATAQLLLQATSENVYCHPMAGYHKDKLIEALKLDESKQPLCVIALGYLQSHELLEEPFKTREITPRVRKSVAEISKKL